MKHVWTLAAITAAALVGHTPAAALDAPRGTGPIATPTSGGSPTASDEASARTLPVTDVSVVPGTGRADVVIAVDSSVRAQDFVLEAEPYRVVLDLTGATLDIAPRFYDKVARGSITNIRYAQYRAGVVRVVIELNAPHEYTVTRSAHDLRLAI